MWALLRTNRDLRWVFIAQVISFLGDWFVFVALAGYIDGRHRLRVPRVARARLVLAAVVPRLAAGRSGRRPVDRRKVLLVVSAAQALAASGLLLLAEDRIWVAFVFQGLVAALAAFVKPCIDAAIPNLARDEDELRKANALMGSTWGVMLAVGAGLGGLFSQAFGRRASIVADVATFVVAGLVFSLVRRPMQGRRSSATGRRRGPPIEHTAPRAMPWRRCRPPPRRPGPPGRRHARGDRRRPRDKVILALLCSKATFAIGAGVVSQLAVLASDVFDSGDRGRGFLLAAAASGPASGRSSRARWTGGSLRRVMSLVRLGLARRSRRPTPSPPGRRRSPIALAFVFLAHLGGGRQLDAVDLRPAAPRRRLGARAGHGGRLRHPHARAQRHQHQRRPALVGRGSPVGDHRVRRARRGSPAPCIWFRPGRSARIWRPDMRRRRPPRTHRTACASHFTEHRERPIDSDRHPRTDGKAGRADDGVRRTADG